MPLLQVEGARAEFAIAEETTFKGGTTGVTYWTGFRVNRGSIGSEVALFESQELRSDRMTAAVLRGNRTADGDFGFELGPESHQMVLRHTLGGNWALLSGADPYFWRLTPAPFGAFPTGGLVISKFFTDLSKGFTYSGGRVDSLALEFPQQGIVSGALRVLTCAESDVITDEPYTSLNTPLGDPYESNLTLIEFQPYDATDTIAELEAEGAWSTPEAVAAGGRLNITNSLDGNSFVLGSYSRYSVPAGRRRVEGSLNLLFNDTDKYEDYLDGSPKRCRIRFVSGNYWHTIYLPNVKYIGGRPALDATSEAGIRYDLPFRAIRHANIGYDIWMTTKNAASIVHLSS